MNFNLWFSKYILPIDDPGSRLFHWNIIAAIALLLAWAIYTSGFKGGVRGLKRLIFRKKYWWNHSTRRDYLILFLNSLFKVFLFVPFLDFSFQIARYTSKSLISMSGDFVGLAASSIFIAAFTVFSFVWDDFLRFFQHFLMHKIPWLWRLHSVHHSAKILTPVTLYRAHPLESAIAALRNSLSLGVSAGFFVFIFEAQLSLWTIAGVNVFGFLFNFLGANLRHSHIPIRFGILEKVFISPLQHQIHHSTSSEHLDKNFGVSLSLWDQLFGSWMGSKGVGKLNFGLGTSHRRSLAKEMGLPDLKSYKKAWKSPVVPLPIPVEAEPILQTQVAPHKAF